MRLLRCTSCEDIFKIYRSSDERYCVCGRSSARINEAGDLEFCGPAIILGIKDSTLKRAIEIQPKQGNGPHFYAFVFPKEVYQDATPSAVQERHQG